MPLGGTGGQYHQQGLTDRQTDGWMDKLNTRELRQHLLVGESSSWKLIKYRKTCLKRPLKMKTKIGFQDRLSLNAGQKYCRMLQESILQYFRPSLSYHMPLRSLFCLFVSGPLRQVLLFM